MGAARAAVGRVLPAGGVLRGPGSCSGRGQLSGRLAHPARLVVSVIRPALIAGKAAVRS